MKSSKGKKFKTVTYTNANDYKTLKEIGLISDSITSFVASVAMGILLIIPALMAIIAMFKQNIDFTMNLYIPMIKHLAFPFACAILSIVVEAASVANAGGCPFVDELPPCAVSSVG